MKPFAFVLLLLIHQPVLAQRPAPTKIYFVAINGVNKLYTTFNPKQPIKVDYGRYTLVETNADSLGLVINNAPVFIPFDAGKAYYFGIEHGSLNRVEEMTQRQFWLTVYLYANRQPRYYFISEKTPMVIQE